jgi:hypothetical protein
MTSNKMREYIQEPREGHNRSRPASPGASRSSFEDFCSSSHCSLSYCSYSSYHEKHFISPLKVERTLGVGRSRSMIVEVSVQGKSPNQHRREGSLTVAVSVDALPRAGSSRRYSLDTCTHLQCADSPPIPPRRQASIRDLRINPPL